MTTTRDDLELQAKSAICSCWYYDLCNDIDSLSDDELESIINVPFYAHLQDYIHNSDMVSINELIEGLQECSDYKASKVATK